MSAPSPEHTPHPQRPSQLPQGFVLPGGYVIEGMLGAGGFGAVYAARDPALARPVAVKLLTRELTGQAAERFRDEGRLLAKLRHPHIIQVYASGELPGADGRAYLVMERFGEGSLASHWPLGTCPPLEVATHVTQQLLSALSAAHEAGVIHRDVKEANVLYDPQRREIKLCDFGIARSLTPLPEQAETTQEGVVVGTDHYIAPERLVGVHDDPRSDLYSVGVLMYRLLTGHRPFERSAEERPARPMILLRSLQETPTLPEHIPLRWRRLCLALLARDPAHRPESAARALQMLSDADNVASTESAPISLTITPQPATSRSGERRASPPSSRVKLTWLAVGLLLPALIFGLKALLRSPQRQATSPRAKVIKLHTSPAPTQPLATPTPPLEPSAQPSQPSSTTLQLGSTERSTSTQRSPERSSSKPHKALNSKRQREQRRARRSKQPSRQEKGASRTAQPAQPAHTKDKEGGGSPFFFPNPPQGAKR